MTYSCLHCVDVKKPPLIPIIEKNERLSPSLATILFRRPTCVAMGTKYILLADTKNCICEVGGSCPCCYRGTGGVSVVRCTAWDLNIRRRSLHPCWGESSFGPWL